MNNIKMDSPVSPASLSPVIPSSPVNNAMASFIGVNSNNKDEADDNEKVI